MSFFSRPQVSLLAARLDEPVRNIQIVAGPRQVGKTTLVRQACDQREEPYSFHSSDDVSNVSVDAGAFEFVPQLKNAQWLIQIWEQARLKARIASPNSAPYTLVIDEIQKIDNWSSTVKGLWDRDRANSLKLHVVLLGSSPLLVQKGLSESLTGRFEAIHLSHWSFPEMQDAFGLSLDEFVFFGGYPGAAVYRRNDERWRDYINDAFVTPSIEHDVLAMAKVDKPALLKNLFLFGADYSGQVLSLNKIVPHLEPTNGKAHESTLANYLALLNSAGLLSGLQKYTGKPVITRNSAPKFNVHNTALMSATAGYTFEQAKADRTHWGRLVESTVGAYLVGQRHDGLDVFYWREDSIEVDFVVRMGKRLLAIEVKSNAKRASVVGLNEFAKRFGESRAVTALTVGGDGVPLEEFLSTPTREYFKAKEA